MATVLTDIGKILNDKPLTCVSSDPDEILPLRPSDLLYGNQALPALPEINEVIEKCELASATVLSERWKHQQNILNAFWKRFRREYLLQLRSNVASRPIRSRSIKIGDVVLLDDPAASRSYWPMGRVQAFCESGIDGKNRTCMVEHTTGKTLRRPIQLLYPLELSKY